MLVSIQPPALRHTTAKQWLLFNEGKCDYARMIYIRNNASTVLGTAWNRELELLTWGLVAPSAPKQQAVQKKRRL
jgi:hypothetical protein